MPVVPAAVPVPAPMTMMVVMMPSTRAHLAIVRDGLVVGFGFGGRVGRDRPRRRGAGFGLLQHRGGLRCGSGGGDRACSSREAERHFQEFASFHRSNLSLLGSCVAPAVPRRPVIPVAIICRRPHTLGANG